MVAQFLKSRVKSQPEGGLLMITWSQEGFLGSSVTVQGFEVIQRVAVIYLPPCLFLSVESIQRDRLSRVMVACIFSLVHEVIAAMLLLSILVGVTVGYIATLWKFNGF